MTNSNCSIQSNQKRSLKAKFRPLYFTQPTNQTNNETPKKKKPSILDENPILGKISLFLFHTNNQPTNQPNNETHKKKVHSR
jgi:hypothetical protein